MRLPEGRHLKSPESNAKRLELIREAVAWPGRWGDEPIETLVYDLDADVSVGARKPGKEANPERMWVNEHDMLPIIRQGGVTLGFDSGFGDIFRALYDIGVSSSHTPDERAARLLGALLYRAAWALDHVKDAGGRWRLRIPEEAAGVLDGMQIQRVRTPGLHQDLSVRVILEFLEILALNEDIKYFYRNGERLKGSQGRTNTMQTCTRALACGLGEEHPMSFAYGLSRGNGVASLNRTIAEGWFPELA